MPISQPPLLTMLSQLPTPEACTSISTVEPAYRRLERFSCLMSKTAKALGRVIYPPLLLRRTDESIGCRECRLLADSSSSPARHKAAVAPIAGISCVSFRRRLPNWNYRPGPVF
jgi:hypothetical protein